MPLRNDESWIPEIESSAQEPEPEQPQPQLSSGSSATSLGKRSERKPFDWFARGRVEAAVFNCPRCSLLLRYRAKTAWRQSCPGCNQVLYVRLLLGLPSGRGKRARTRPAASMVQLAEGQTEIAEMIATAEGNQAPSEPRDPLPKVRVEEWTPELEPYHRVEEIGEWEPGEPDE